MSQLPQTIGDHETKGTKGTKGRPRTTVDSLFSLVSRSIWSLGLSVDSLFLWSQGLFGLLVFLLIATSLGPFGLFGLFGLSISSITSGSASHFFTLFTLFTPPKRKKKEMQP